MNKTIWNVYSKLDRYIKKREKGGFKLITDDSFYKAIDITPERFEQLRGIVYSMTYEEAKRISKHFGMPSSKLFPNNTSRERIRSQEPEG